MFSCGVLIILLTGREGSNLSAYWAATVTKLRSNLLRYKFVLFHPRIAQSADLKPGFERSACPLMDQDRKGPGEESLSSTSALVAIGSRNNSIG